ncbi:MAG: peptidase M14 [Bacteroidetes bacterium SW_9_63_38]|nr:MAG: peptidase M14 [Bacteroidetes bacterium SW_9_63_38]
MLLLPLFQPRARLLVLVLGGMIVGAGVGHAQVPTPADVFGFEPGADYKMADYDQLTQYYRQLSAASDRVNMTEIGTSAEGRSLKLLLISSTDNLKSLDRWREISATLARARVNDKKARQLAEEGRAVIWIDAGLHSTEPAPGQALPRLAYRMATDEGPEMRAIRDNTVLLLMPMMNPDGLETVKQWYDRVLNTPYETTDPPRLYHPYAGHSTNRDWFMNNLPETRAVTEVLYNEWYPQIVLDHHQTAPEWARIFIPPFAEPVNSRIHPDVVAGVNEIGTAMGQRFAEKKMPGVISGDTYTMYWNGGMRTTPYFHNQLGILTEVAHATPSPQYYATDSTSARAGTGTGSTAQLHTAPWSGGDSHFRDAVEYTNTASMAVLDHAARKSTELLYNMYEMGRDAIEKGQSGDPYAYVVPPDQWHPREAHNLINILRQGGVEVQRATASFEAEGTTYPAGSFVVPTAQAFRPYVLDLMEPQSYPAQRTSDGQLKAPYDRAGWTLPMQMGVTAHRIASAFEAPLEAVRDSVRPAPGTVRGNDDFGYVLSHRPNTSIEVVHDLLAAGEQVYWVAGSVNEHGFTNGDIVVRRQSGTRARIQALARTHGLDVQGLPEAPQESLRRLRPPKVGIYKSWVPSQNEGWTRWLMKQYDLPVDILRDDQIRNGDLSQYTTIILPHHRSTDKLLSGHERGAMPAPFVGGLGLDGALALERYVKAGGTLLAVDRAGQFAIQQFGLPVRDVTRGLPTESLSVPGSLLRTVINTEHPLGYGLPDTVAASFMQSRAFEPVQQRHAREGGGEASSSLPVEVVARYAEDDLLMSGWARGAKRHIGGMAAVMRVQEGKGNVVLFGARPQFRGQPRGTFKLLFNAVHAATIDEGAPQRASTKSPAQPSSRSRLEADTEE